MPSRLTAEEFWGRGVRDAATGCLLWTGRRLPKGYGQISGRKLAHHRAYEMAVGPIPAGAHVLHSCDTPPCFEPTHLFLGTNRDNVRDCIAKGRHFWKNKTHCPAGHAYDAENTYIDPYGHRFCKACRREADRRRSAR